MAVHSWKTLLTASAFFLAGTASISSAQYDDSLDVPFVPTPESVVDGMLKLAKVGPQDVLYDLGSGDGRIVITAAERYGATGVGIDIDPARVSEAQANARTAGVDDKVRFIQGDLFEADFSAATVVTLYLLNSVNEEIRPRLLTQLRPGTRVVSHAFGMGPWEPDATAVVDGADIYLWIVPAQAGGQWIATIEQPQGTQEFSMSLQQQFQHLLGIAVMNGAHTVLENALVQGDQLAFVMDDGNGGQHRLAGRIDGDTIEGWVYAGDATTPVGRWTATRVGDETTGRLRTHGN